MQKQNNINLEKTWQQMNLAYERGASTVWIVNVGDIKPLVFYDLPSSMSLLLILE